MSDKRIQLQKVATDAVQRSGLNNLSFRTLADQVGVKSSSVHYYFPEKGDLAGALIENYTDDFMSKLETIERQKKSLKQKLTSFVKIFEEVSSAEKFCLCGMMAAEIAMLNDTNRVLLSQYFNKIEDWLFEQFEKHSDQNASDLDSRNLDSRTLARLTLSGLEGAILLDRVEAKNHRLLAQKKLILSLIA
ncbi:MAG: TetR family transcriptional regulator [Cocleimonas sp.]